MSVHGSTDILESLHPGRIFELRLTLVKGPKGPERVCKHHVCLRMVEGDSHVKSLCQSMQSIFRMHLKPE